MTTVTTPTTTPDITRVPRPDIEPERVRKPDEYCPEQRRRLVSPDVEP
jgi:hypothetical protein